MFKESSLYKITIFSPEKKYSRFDHSKLPNITPYMKSPPVILELFLHYVRIHLVRQGNFLYRFKDLLGNQGETFHKNFLDSYSEKEMGITLRKRIDRNLLKIKYQYAFTQFQHSNQNLAKNSTSRQMLIYELLNENSDNLEHQIIYTLWLKHICLQIMIRINFGWHKL